MKKEVVAEYLSRDEIKRRVTELGRQITNDFEGKNLIVIGVLKGSFIFMADLLREIELPLEVSFISVSSYGAGTSSSGEVRLLYDVDKPLEGKNVIIVEDIIDSGHTAGFLLDAFNARKAASIKICSLLNKPSRRVRRVEADYVGFDIDDKFVVGYGLDYDGRYRNLPNVSILSFMD